MYTNLVLKYEYACEDSPKLADEDSLDCFLRISIYIVIYNINMIYRMHSNRFRPRQSNNLQVPEMLQ